MLRVRFRQLSLALRTALASAMFGLVIVSAGIGVGYRALSQQSETRSAGQLNGKRNLVAHILSELPSLSCCRRQQPSVQRPADRARRCPPCADRSPHGHRSLQLLSHSLKVARVLDAAAADAAAVNWSPRSGPRLTALRGEAPVGDGTPTRYYLCVEREYDRS